MKRVKRVLSIDGGGIRGLIPAVVCRKIEEWSGQRVSQLFDLIAGSSTGGILALGLSAPPSGRSASELVDFYLKQGPKIFSRPRSTFGQWFGPKYSGQNLVDAAERTFGAAKLSEAAAEVLVTAYDIRLRRPLYFERNEARLNSVHDYRMADIAVATSAAPTIFPPAKLGEHVVIDGGILANNPALAAYAHAKTLWPKDEVFLVSLGTGTADLPLRPEDAANWGTGKWIRPLIDSLFDGTAHTAHDFFRKTQLNRYHRFQCSLNQLTNTLDGVGEHSLMGLQQLAESMATNSEGPIFRVIQELKDAGNSISARIDRPFLHEKVKLGDCSVDGTISNYRNEALYLFTGFSRYWPSARIVPTNGRWAGVVNVGVQESGAKITLAAVDPQLAAYIELYRSQQVELNWCGIEIPNFPEPLDQVQVYLDHSGR